MRTDFQQLSPGVAGPGMSSLRRPAVRWLLLAGVVGALLAVVGVGVDLRVLAGPVVAVVGWLVAVADLRCRRVPDRWVLCGLVAAAVLAVSMELVGGERPGGRMLLGAAFAALPLLVVHLARPAGMGFGDVKFAAVVGALLGVVNPQLALLALASACLLAVAGTAVRAWRAGSIPFALCLAAAATLCLAVGDRWPRWEGL